MIDHVARTKAQIEACLKRGQWQQIVKIGGFKSEQEARAHHQVGYSKKVEPIIDDKPPLSMRQADKIERLKQEQVKPAHMPPRVIDRTADDAKWVANIRSRLADLGLSSQELSLSMRKDKAYVSNELGTSGRRSENTRANIECALRVLETSLLKAAE